MSKKPKQTKCHTFPLRQDHWLTRHLVTRSLTHADAPFDPCALSKFSGLLSQTERRPRVGVLGAPPVAWPCSGRTRSLRTDPRDHPSGRGPVCSSLAHRFASARRLQILSRFRRRHSVCRSSLWSSISRVVSLLLVVLKPSTFRKCADTSKA